MAFDLIQWILDKGEPTEATIALGIYLLCKDEDTSSREAVAQVMELLKTLRGVAMQIGAIAGPEGVAEFIHKDQSTN